MRIFEEKNRHCMTAPYNFFCVNLTASIDKSHYPYSHLWVVVSRKNKTNSIIVNKARFVLHFSFTCCIIYKKDI